MSIQFWQQYPLIDEQQLGFQAGPLAFAIQRLQYEWRISYQYDGINPVDEESLQLESNQPAGELQLLERFMFSHAPEQIQLLPHLADRPVVSRPVQPIHLPAGEEVTLYVSSPIWIAFSVDATSPTLLKLPIIRPSDTWFGATTISGELCYASRTSGFTHLDEVPLRPHRAITPVLIRNHATGDLQFERTAIPVPLLSLFIGDNGQLWTEQITLTRAEDDEMASLRIGEGAPHAAGHYCVIAAPGQKSSKGLLYRAFSNLFR